MIAWGEKELASGRPPLPHLTLAVALGAQTAQKATRSCSTLYNYVRALGDHSSSGWRVAGGSGMTLELDIALSLLKTLTRLSDYSSEVWI